MKVKKYTIHWINHVNRPDTFFATFAKLEHARKKLASLSHPAAISRLDGNSFVEIERNLPA